MAGRGGDDAAHTAALAAIAARLQMDAAFEHEAGLPDDAAPDARRTARLACLMRAADYRARVRELERVEPMLRAVLDEVHARPVAAARPQGLPVTGRPRGSDGSMDDWEQAE